MQLTAMIFPSSADGRSRIEELCAGWSELLVLPTPLGRPSDPEMIRMINSERPELALVELRDKEDALSVAETLNASCPSVAVLGFSTDWQHETLVRTGNGYQRVISTDKLDAKGFVEAALGAVAATKGTGPDNLIVFMPSKAGSGASTIALNVTAALANECTKSAILMEADLHSGPAGMYLNLNSTRTVIDALTESRRLDEKWNELITPVGNFGILPSCNVTEPFPEPSPWAYQRLLAYVKPRYEYVIFDLPEVVTRATEAIVTRAKTVYVVCMPEVSSLMLGRKRCAGLIERGVSPDRVQVILNRYSKDSPEPAAVAEILGYPVTQVIPNDYKSLWEANLKRQLVDEKSEVGKAFASFSWSLTGRPPEPVKPIRKLFGLLPSALTAK